MSMQKDLMDRYMHGHLSRREFLTKLATLGLSAPAISAILAACAPVATPTPDKIAETVAAPTPTEVPTVPVKPYEGRTVSVVTLDSDMSQMAEAQIPVFEAESGAKVNFSKIPDDVMPKADADLRSGAGVYDVIIAPAFPAFDLMDAGFIEPLEDFVAADATIAFDDFIEALVQAYSMWKGTLYALPYKPDVYIFYYRKDLFADAKVQEAFNAKTGKDLKVPDTVGELIETARFFTRTFNPDSPIEYGFVHWGVPVGAHWVWASRLAAYGGSYLDENFHPNFNNEAGRKAMEVGLALTECSNPDMGGYNFLETCNEFLSGKAAMVEMWPVLAAMAETEEGWFGRSEVVGKVGYAISPGDIVGGELTKSSVLGGWSIIMSKYAKDKELAYQFMKFATSKEAEPLRIPAGGAPCRKSSYEDPEIAAADPSYPVLSQCLEQARITAQVVAPPVGAELQEILGTDMQKVWVGQIEGEEGLEHVEKEWTEILQREGLYK